MSGELFEYAVLRAVPRPERGERVNVGVALYCPSRGYLAVRTHVDPDRLRALCPKTDPELLERHLSAFARVCEGGRRAGATGELSARQRFGLVVAPRSTLVQPSPVHTGFTQDPEQTLERLLGELVLTG